MRDALIVALDALDGRVEGKTRLQKTMYVAGVKTGLDFGFRNHFFGPYSDEISNELARLRLIGVVRMSPGQRDPIMGGFELSGQVFELTEMGVLAAKRIYDRDPEAAKQLRDAIVEISKLSSELDYQQLSFATKVHFAIENKLKDNVSIIFKESVDFNWPLQEDDVEKAQKFLDQVNLAQPT